MLIDTYELLNSTQYSAHMLWYGIEMLDKGHSLNPPYSIVVLRERLFRKFSEYPLDVRNAARSVARDYLMLGYAELDWRR